MEVRLRHNQRNLYKADREELDAKKSLFAGAIAVYVMYGTGNHRDGTPKTRIHLADPENEDGAEASDLDIASSAIHYYLNLVSQVGLWDYRDHLQKAARAAAEGAAFRQLMPAASSNQVRLGQSQDVLGELHRGRTFNSLLFDAGTHPISLADRDSIRRRAWARVDAGDFGVNTFRGISQTALDFISTCAWQDLADYRRSTVADSETTTVREDGVSELRSEVTPDSSEANEIIQSLPDRPRSR